MELRWKRYSPSFFFFKSVPRDSAHHTRACSLPASEVQDRFLGIYLFGCLFRLDWVFTAAPGLSLVVAGGGYRPVWCGGFSLQRLLWLWSRGSGVRTP